MTNGVFLLQISLDALSNSFIFVFIPPIPVCLGLRYTYSCAPKLAYHRQKRQSALSGVSIGSPDIGNMRSMQFLCHGGVGYMYYSGVFVGSYTLHYLRDAITFPFFFSRLGSRAMSLPSQY